MTQTLEEPSLPKKVAIIYSDVKREYFATEDEYISEEGADRKSVV